MREIRVGDLETLRALAHPLRMRLLVALRLDGPATASELGRRFGESSGAASYHLRQLHRYGFVEDDNQPSRRERRWRAAQEWTSVKIADFLYDPAGHSALRVMERERLEFIVRLMQAWYAERASWPREWVEAAVDSDARLWLRLAEFEALRADLSALVREYAGRQAAPGDPAAAPVYLVLEALPVKELPL
jgi:DNA-binding transcriptional ArsR family regulator